MRIFLDCEFNGFRGELISMALVPEVSCAAGEWYEVIEFCGYYDRWVAENVVPLLGKPPLLKGEFRASLLRYIQWFERPEIISDWHSDIIHFCDILQGDNFKESVPFEGKFTIIQTPEGEPKPEIPHNALSDARALRDWYLDRRIAASVPSHGGYEYNPCSGCGNVTIAIETGKCEACGQQFRKEGSGEC